MKKIGTASSIFVFCVFIVIFTLISAEHFLPRYLDKILYLTLGLLAAAVPAYLLIARAVRRITLPVLGTKTVFFLLLAACVAVKLAFVLCWRVEYTSDYATFWGTAVKLSQSYTIENARYIEFFPHIFGYSHFLSFFLMVFGPHKLIAPLVNVALTAASMALIWHIAMKIMGKRAAVIASVLWILLPSQTIYNVFALSEPLYTLILLCLWALLLRADEKLPGLRWISLFAYAAAGALLAVLFNITRPLALIVIISLFIWFFILRMDGLKNASALIRRSAFFISLAGMYVLFGYAADAYIESRLGGEIAKTPGYSIMVGFNEKSGGRWNQADGRIFSEFFSQPDLTAEEANREMLDIGVERIKTVRLHEFIPEKLRHLWGTDAMAASYASITPEIGHRFNLIVRSLSESVYFGILFAAIAASAILAHKRHTGFLSVIALYPIGMTFAHMLAEVAPRYHYSGIASFILLASYPLSKLRVFKAAKEPEAPGPKGSPD